MIYRYDKKKAARRLRGFSVLSEFLFLLLSLGIGFVIAFLLGSIIREKVEESKQILVNCGCYLIGILIGLPGHFSRKKLRMTGYADTANGSIAVFNKKFSKKTASKFNIKLVSLLDDEALLYQCATGENDGSCAIINKVYAMNTRKHSVDALCDLILPNGKHKKQSITIRDYYTGYQNLVANLENLNKLTTLKIRT